MLFRSRAIAAALEDYPRVNHRHAIIHACLPTAEGIALCKRYNIILPVQTAFINWPQEPDAYLQEILGDRARHLNPLRTFVKTASPSRRAPTGRAPIPIRCSGCTTP